MQNQTQSKPNSESTEKNRLAALLLAAIINRVMNNDPIEKAKLIKELEAYTK